MGGLAGLMGQTRKSCLLRNNKCICLILLVHVSVSCVIAFCLKKLVDVHIGVLNVKFRNGEFGGDGGGQTGPYL